MLLQTNSYIVPKEKRAEHARLMRRFRQVMNKLGCDNFEVYEQVGANWGTGQTSGRFVQIMRFRDRKHQMAVQNAERSDPAAQELIAEFCELVNYPLQQQQGYFAVGFYSSVLPVAPVRVRGADAGQGDVQQATLEDGGEPGQAPAQTAAPAAPDRGAAAGVVAATAAGAAAASFAVAASERDVYAGAQAAEVVADVPAVDVDAAPPEAAPSAPTDSSVSHAGGDVDLQAELGLTDDETEQDLLEGEEAATADDAAGAESHVGSGEPVSAEGSYDAPESAELAADGVADVADQGDEGIAGELAGQDEPVTPAEEPLHFDSRATEFEQVGEPLDLSAGTGAPDGSNGEAAAMSAEDDLLSPSASAADWALPESADDVEIEGGAEAPADAGEVSAETLQLDQADAKLDTAESEAPGSGEPPRAAPGTTPEADELGQALAASTDLEYGDDPLVDVARELALDDEADSHHDTTPRERR